MDNEPAPKRQRVEEAEGGDAPTTENSGIGDAATNTTDAAAGSAAQEASMPPCPRVPPEASDLRKVRRDGGWRWASRHGMDPPPAVYGPRDTALWPEEAAELFRATKINRDAKYASRYMRWWFEEHQGMPGRVPKIPRSAYSTFYTKRKREIFLSAGRFHQKKDGRKIGAEWKALEDADKRPYMDRFAALQAQRGANEEWWNEKLSAWREERLGRLRSEGVELDQLKRQGAGLEPICECSKCGPASGATELG